MKWMSWGWHSFIDVLRLERSMLSSALERAEILSADDHTINLVVPGVGRFWRQQIESDDSRLVLNRLAFDDGICPKWRVESDAGWDESSGELPRAR